MRKLSALFILIVVFIPLTFAAMTLASIRPWILDRGFYEGVVNDEALYEAMLTDEMPRRFNRDTFTEVEQLPVEALGTALREVLTADYLQAQSLHVVDKVFDYFEGRERDFELSLDITPIKEALRGEGKTRFAAALAAALPACSAGQKPIAPGGRLSRCVADGDSIGVTAEQITAALPAVLEDTPDQIVLNDDAPYIRMNWYDFGWLPSGSVLAGLDITVLTMIFTAVAAGFVGAYLGGDDLRERLKWFSSALFFPGSLYLAAGLFLASPYVLRQIASSIPSLRYSDAFREAVINITVEVIQRMGGGVLLTGLITCLIAGGVLILSVATPTHDRLNSKIVQVPVHNP